MASRFDDDENGCVKCGSPGHSAEHCVNEPKPGSTVAQLAGRGPVDVSWRKAIDTEGGGE